MPGEGNYIKQYGAADLQRYHSGKMSEQEMHELEKAALDDPFLNDALEGYTFAHDPVADIRELKEKLGEEKKDKKVIPIKSRPFSILLRIAAMLLFVVGVSWALFIRNNNSAPEKDLSIVAQKTVPSKTSEIKTILSTDTFADYDDKNYVAIEPSGKSKKKGTFKTEQKYRDSLKANFTLNAASGSVGYSTTIISDSLNLALTPSATKKVDDALQGKVAGLDIKSQSQVNQSNVQLKGRVVNTEGQPVAFANVVDRRNNISVNTDKDGVFDLAANGAVSNVSVNALGYKSTNQDISNDSVQSNLVVLERASAQLNEVVVSGMSNSKKRKDYYSPKGEKQAADPRRITVTNAIPINGWQEFNKYVTDSLKTVEQLGASATSAEVLVTFDVNDNGEPVDINISKSLCSICDAEALRIIKKSPAWKLNKKRKKAKAVVRF